MANTVAREPRTVIRGTLYRGHEGMWSWVLHRITGVGMYFFLLVHILDTATVRLDPELYNVVMEAYKTPIMGLGEAGLVAAIVFHAFNGLRITLVDMTAWASRHHRALFYGVLVLWTVVMVAFLPRHLMHVFGG